MITQLEELSINAWPSLQTMLYDGWVIRFSDGHTRRANSSNPLYEGVLGLDGKIDVCEKMYSDRHLDTVFKMTTASCPPGLDSTLAARGYSLVSGSAVQTLDLNGVTGPDESNIALSPDASDEWISAYCQMSGLDEWKKETERRMLLNVVSQKRLASISKRERSSLAEWRYCREAKLVCFTL